MISLEKVWPEWKIEKQIGRGTFGIVYQAVRQHSSLTNRAAIKVISIPQDPYELETLRFDGLDMCDSRTYIESIVNDYVNEIRLLESFKGIQNIVSIEDYKVIEKIDDIGWDIYIRMELLKPLNAYVCDKKMTEKEVIQLGCDICTALEICGQRNIIHRDIKPENIFVNDFGSFKLGDFGTARTMESMICDLSQKGTYSYMAPEVMNGGDYDARVDIYSLGLVLYRLMNSFLALMNGGLPWNEDNKGNRCRLPVRHLVPWQMSYFRPVHSIGRTDFPVLPSCDRHCLQ